MKTDEEKVDYQVKTDEAMKLLHGEISAEIESSRIVTQRRDGKLVGVEKPSFIKLYTSFKQELQTIEGNDLKVWIFIVLSVNRYTKDARPGLRAIAEGTGLAVNTARDCIERLEKLGLLDVEKEGGKSNIYHPADYVSVSKIDTVKTGTVSKNEGTVSKNEGTVSVSLLQNAQLEELEELETSGSPILLDERVGLEWVIAHGKKVTPKQLFKQSEMKAFDDMLDAQFRRLRLNFSAFDEKAKEAFRRFIRTQPQDQTLERFVSWWLEDEWRAANPPYTLAVIMQRWLQAFDNGGSTSSGEYRPRISA